MKRRTVLKAGLIAVPAASAAALGGAGLWWAGADLNTAGKVRFVNRLAIPPLAPPRGGTGPAAGCSTCGRAGGEHRFRAGRPTPPPGGINGPYLAPTLRAARGETVTVRFRNDLPESTTLHWHGMHVPARMDGGPHQPVRPGATWSPTWTVDQPAATLWYHPHPHGRTALHVYRGLAGLFILDDPHPHGLPDRYGIDDIPVIVRDLNLTDHNELDERDREQGGVGIVGDLVTVNGTPAPYLPVTTQRVRLRLLNGSNARIYRFGFGSGRTFALVGTDGGLLAAPYETGHVQLSPGERAEIVVALRPGERDVLRSLPPETGLNLWDRRWTGGDDTLDVMELRAAPRLARSSPLPARLAEAPRLVTDPATPPVRRFELSGFTINGRSMDMNRVDFAVPPRAAPRCGRSPPSTTPRTTSTSTTRSSRWCRSAAGSRPRNCAAGRTPSTRRPASPYASLCGSAENRTRRRPTCSTATSSTTRIRASWASSSSRRQAGPRTGLRRPTTSIDGRAAGTIGRGGAERLPGSYRPMRPSDRGCGSRTGRGEAGPPRAR
ncbi:hypothetical protein GCM10020001_111350 [Nonomuraea salmonea]